MKPDVISKLAHEVRELAEALAEAGKKSDVKDLGCACCEIPETQCPPRCVGEIAWTFARGAAPEATIVVRNVGHTTRQFHFTASELVGIDPGNAQITILPPSATLAPGKTVRVRVSILDSMPLQPCQDYHAELSIRGAWEQCVKVVCKVVRDPFDSTQIDAHHSLLHGAGKPVLRWELERGVAVHGKVTVHNSSKETVTLNFETTPLLGPDAPTEQMTVTPASMRLGAGQSSVVRVSLANTRALSAGQTYEAELLVDTQPTQRVALSLGVLPDPGGYLEVEQGEAPTHLRAHRWYDHFQCTEPCTQPHS